ncbi:MAG: hypothetical protein HY904_07165 [Deltaproteobacteria bacterium]|nr:hypothetical protein [Deltaproteobacteria bacterium]
MNTLRCALMLLSLGPLAGCVAGTPDPCMNLCCTGCACCDSAELTLERVQPYCARPGEKCPPGDAGVSDVR